MEEGERHGGGSATGGKAPGERPSRRRRRRRVRGPRRRGGEGHPPTAPAGGGRVVRQARAVPPRAVRVVRALDGPNRAGRATGRVGGDAERRHAPHARIARARGGGRGADWTRRARRCGGRLAKDDS